MLSLHLHIAEVDDAVTNINVNEVKMTKEKQTNMYYFHSSLQRAFDPKNFFDILS